MTGVLTSNAQLRDHWYAVARGEDISDAPVAAQVLGTKLAIWRGADGVLTAVPDRCADREGPLSKGEVESGCLVCPYHGWTYEPGGRCVRVPSASEGVPPPPRAHLTPFGCQERYGLVWVSVGKPASDISQVCWEDDPAYRRINPPVEVWQTSTPRMTDNFLDVTHFPYVHRGTFGADAGPPDAEGRARLARRRVLRLPLRGHGRQHGRWRRVHWSGCRCRPPPDDDRLPPALRRAQHDPLRHRARPHPVAALDTDRRRDLVLHVRRVAQRRFHAFRPTR